MGRPTKAINSSSGKIGKDTIEARKVAEGDLKGCADKIKPPVYLTVNQKRIFKFIVEELEASGILGNLDIYVLTTTCIAIDRLEAIETIVNENTKRLKDKDLMSSKDKYTKDLWRGVNELSLSPQSRAKIANLNLQVKNDENDPLLKALSGDSD